MTLSRYSPQTRARDRRPPVPATELPHLQRSSDIIWTQWEEITHASSNLKWIVMAQITNDQTLQVLRRALAEVNRVLQLFPGTWFGSGTEQFQAIMGMQSLS